MKKYIVLLTSIMFLGLFTFAQETKVETLTTSDTGPQVSWEQQTVDFGEIPQNIPVTAEYKVTNSGKSPLIITSVQASCGCTATDYPKEPVQPGETAVVKATFNAKAVGTFSKTVTVFTNTTEGRSTLILKGKVKAS